VWVPNSFWRKLSRAGVEVRVVNPPSLYRGTRRFLARDHRKLVGVDGLYASVGGICIADGWLERSSETGLIYRDTAANLRGPAVADVERAFAPRLARAGPSRSCPRPPRRSRPTAPSTARSSSSTAPSGKPFGRRTPRLNRLLVSGVLRRERSHLLHDLLRVNAFDCRCKP
jgi:cardiolipin synthase A/B